MFSPRPNSRIRHDGASSASAPPPRRERSTESGDAEACARPPLLLPASSRHLDAVGYFSGDRLLRRSNPFAGAALLGGGNLGARPVATPWHDAPTTSDRCTSTMTTTTSAASTFRRNSHKGTLNNQGKPAYFRKNKDANEPKTHAR
jgi:hypothetical protein